MSATGQDMIDLKTFQFSHIPYIIIIVLLVLLTCERGKETIVEKPIIRVDTVYKYKIVRDTVKGKTIYIKGKKDTLWITKADLVPKSTYDSLLEQYKNLGNLYFKKNVFSTRFDIQNYGYVEVKDSISENWILDSELTSHLKIPEKTITVIKEDEPKRQLYVGAILTGTKVDIMNSANVGLLYKDKKDRLFGGQIGVTPNGTQFGVSSYFKIKVK